MAVYPTLSQPPLVQPWEEGVNVDPTIKSPTEAGYVLTRSRFTRIPWKWHVAYSGLTQTDKDNMVTFEKAVKVGSDSWTWTHPLTSATYTVRFLVPLRYKYDVSGLTWAIEFDIGEV